MPRWMRPVLFASATLVLAVVLVGPWLLYELALSNVVGRPSSPITVAVSCLSAEHPGWLDLRRAPHCSRGEHLVEMSSFIARPDRYAQFALVSAVCVWARGVGCSEPASDALLESESSHAVHRALGFEENGARGLLSQGAPYAAYREEQ